MGWPSDGFRFTLRSLERGSGSWSVVDKAVGENDWAAIRCQRGSTKAPLFFNSQRFLSTDNFQPFSTSFRTVKMSYHNTNSFNNTSSLNNTNSFNVTDSYNKVLNNYTVVDDRSQILTWLSPLEPRLRHRDIQESRIENVGEWVLETEEFKSWYASSGGSGSDNAVLFCYGGPGVGKTYIRY